MKFPCEDETYRCETPCTDKCAYYEGAREFAEWLPQHFDLRFSNNPDVWLDEFFNHTREKALVEWKKGTDNA